MKTKLFITGLALFAITTMGIAQEDRNPQQQNPQGRGYAFVDENKDGICDNLEKGTQRQFRGRGLGPCNGQGMMQGRGKGQGPGQGRGPCNGQGKGPNFVDADNNGVCDRFEENSKESSSKK